MLAGIAFIISVCQFTGGLVDGLDSINMGDLPSFNPDTRFSGIPSMNSLWQEPYNNQPGPRISTTQEQTTPPTTPCKPVNMPAGFAQSPQFHPPPMMAPPGMFGGGWPQYPVPPYLPAPGQGHDGFYPPGECLHTSHYVYRLSQDD